MAGTIDSGGDALYPAKEEDLTSSINYIVSRPPEVPHGVSQSWRQQPVDEILNLSRLRSCFQIVYNLLDIRFYTYFYLLSKKRHSLLSIPTPDPLRLLLAHSFILVLVNSLAIRCLYLELNYIYAFNVVLFMTWTIHIISKF